MLTGKIRRRPAPGRTLTFVDVEELGVLDACTLVKRHQGADHGSPLPSDPEGASRFPLPGDQTDVLVTEEAGATVVRCLPHGQPFLPGSGAEQAARLCWRTLAPHALPEEHVLEGLFLLIHAVIDTAREEATPTRYSEIWEAWKRIVRTGHQPLRVRGSELEEGHRIA